MKNCDMCGVKIHYDAVNIHCDDVIKERIERYELCEKCFKRLNRFIKYESGRNEIKNARKVLRGRRSDD